MAALPGLAQIHGVPPSVTSVNPFTGISSAPPPSVTSMGPFGWQIPPVGVQPNFFPFRQALINSGAFKGRFAFPGAFGFNGFVPFNKPRFRQHGIGFGRGFGFGGGFGSSAVVPIVVPYYTPYPGYPMFYPMGYPMAAAGDYDTGEQESGASRAALYDEEEEAPPPARPAATPIASRPAAAAPEPAPVREQRPTILVFRDGHRLEVGNYAIVGDQLFNFSDSGPRKIALSDLDVNATEKVNDDRGVQFRLPSARGTHTRS